MPDGWREIVPDRRGQDLRIPGQRSPQLSLGPVRLTCRDGGFLIPERLVLEKVEDFPELRHASREQRGTPPDEPPHEGVRILVGGAAEHALLQKGQLRLDSGLDRVQEDSSRGRPHDVPDAIVVAAEKILQEGDGRLQILVDALHQQHGTAADRHGSNPGRVRDP
eukprot:scaffold2113_cov233-Pinguiococcus_pyrenoidosus.AAC.19